MALSYVRAKSPKRVLLENVATLFEEWDTSELDYIIAELEKSNYVTMWNVINAMDYGGMQSRPRLYIVAIRCTLGSRNCPLFNFMLAGWFWFC